MWRALDVQHMTLRSLSRDAIVSYAHRERPLDCAGSYKMEGLGVALFAQMSGTHFTGIIGLPLTKEVELLGRFGVEVPTAGPHPADSSGQKPPSLKGWTEPEIRNRDLMAPWGSSWMAAT